MRKICGFYAIRSYGGVMKLEKLKSVKSFQNGTYRTSKSATQILRNTVKELYRTKNWDGLKKYLLLLEERKMLPKTYRWQIAQACIFMGNIKEALDYLKPIYQKEPLQPDIQLTILDALSHSGVAMDTFNWIKRPVIRPVGYEILNECIRIISASSNGLALCILYNEIVISNPVEFDEFDLLFHIKKDSRFSVLNDSCYFRYTKISLNVMALKRAA